MSECAEILDEILQRTGLDRLKGYPLYAYRVTPGELDRLKNSLIRRLSISSTFRTPEECAAFCLFGAEWFRRNYSSGPWRWQIILEGLECDDRLVDYLRPQIGEITIDGLRWWRVELITTQNSFRYLTTLVCQGGLPLSTIGREGSPLSRFLKTCLKEHERYPSELVDDLIRKYISILPRTLDNDEVHKLIGGIVTTIASLRKQSDESTESGISRFDYLNKYQGGWEKQLPLRVDDPDTRLLLIALLDTEKSKPMGDRAMYISTTLQIKDGLGLVSRTIHNPRLLDDEDFRRMANYSDTDTIPPRMAGFLEAGDRRQHCIALVRSHDGQKVQVSSIGDSTLTGREAYLASQLVFTVGGEEQKRLSVKGGEALPDSPWVFTSEEPHRLIGVGSVRPRDSAVLVAIPKDSEMTLGEASNIEKLEATVADRNLVRLTGQMRIQLEELTFSIRTKSDDEQAFLYELSGSHRRLGRDGGEVWLGLPRVMRIPVAEDEPSSEVSRELVQWRPARGGDWRAVSSDCIGDVWIRVQEGQETQFFTKATVLPPNFKIRTRPSREPKQGTVEIYGLGHVEIHLAHSEQVETEVMEGSDCQLIKVKSTVNRPGPLEFRLNLNNGNSCELSTVCPTSSINIVNAIGESLPPEHVIPVENMDGLRLRVIQPNSHVPQVYEESFGLLVDEARELGDVGICELPLSFMQEHAAGILALSDHPNSEVSFSVRSRNSIKEKFNFNVGRYAQKLKKDHNVNALAPEHLLDGRETTTVFVEFETDSVSNEYQLTVTPLGYPEECMDPATITELSAGRWEIDHSDYSPGYYLAVASLNSTEFLRPLRFVVKVDEFNQQTDALVPNAENLFDRILNLRELDERRTAWDGFFNDLADNSEHLGWARVDELLNESYKLPISTFETIAALTRNPDAVASRAFRNSKELRFWQRLEQLPFLWSLVPINSWVKAAKKIRDDFKLKLEKNGIEDALVCKLLKDWANEFARNAPMHCSGMYCVLMALWRAGFEFDPELLNATPDGRIRGLSLSDRQLEHTRLISQHTRFDTRYTWPNFKLGHSAEVSSILRSTKDLLIKGSLENQWVVLNGPAVAAIYTTHEFELSDELVRQFKRLRATDAEWYDKANAVATLILMSRRYEEDVNVYQGN